MDKTTVTVSAAAERALSALNGDTAEFFIGADFPAFNGHFPDRPLLPGVAHIELCLLAAARLAGRPLTVKTLHKAKFARPVPPGTTLFIKVAAAGDRRDFTVSAGDGALVARLQLTIEPL
jgi:3-hydroxyacyl-[acyl-carrier-protein] dehydratase